MFWERGLSSIVIWDFTAPKLLRRLTIEKGFWVQKDTTNIYKYSSLVNQTKQTNKKKKGEREKDNKKGN